MTPAWLVDLLAEHREDQSCPDTCICEDVYTREDNHYDAHLAEVIAAELRARLESDEMCQQLAETFAYNFALTDPAYTDDAVRAVTTELLGGSDD